MNDFYNEIIDRLGERNQIVKCVEELSELQQVLCKLLSADDGGVNKDKAIEEIADVEIVLNQVKIILEISEEEITNMKNYKIMRTAKRYLNDSEISQPANRGKWLICSDGYYPYCSVCRHEPVRGEMTNYCPQCGAKMDKEE